MRILSTVLLSYLVVGSVSIMDGTVLRNLPTSTEYEKSSLIDIL